MTVRQRYQVLDVDTPAATPIDTPVITDLELGWCVLNSIDLRIPPGPSGLVGVSIMQTGTQIWPWGDLGSWIVGDDEQYSVPINTEIDQGITVSSYNLDVYDHTFYFKFFFTPISVGATAGAPSQAAIVPVF